MDAILNFLADYYIYFMIGAGVLLLALVGFIVDGKNKKKKNQEVVPTAPVTPEAGQTAQPETVLPEAAPMQATADTVTPVEEPSLSGLESTPTEPTLTIENSETPASEEPTLVIGETPTIGETPSAEPAVAEEPTLVIGETPSVEPTSVAEPVVTQSTDANVAPDVVETPTPEAVTAPEVVTPEAPVAPTAPVAPEVVAPAAPTAPETVAPASPETPAAPGTPATK